MTSHADNLQCRRCGTCCEKGGPSFHVKDRAIIDSGALPLKRLFTIRLGEPAHDNVRGGVLPASSDIIKIKPRPGGRACVLYDPETAACRVYTHRPTECRVLNCRDTRALEAIYDKDRLTRKDLLEGVAGLWDLVVEHQSQCAWEAVLPRLEAVRNRDETAMQKVLYRVRYDLQLRDLVTRQGQTDPDLLDFLFGRPMTVILKPMGVVIRQTDGKLSIQNGC